MLTPALIRGARAMLQMSQAELSEKAGISKTGLANLETGQADSRGSTLAAIQAALEDAGAEFVAAGGGGLSVRLRRDSGLQDGGANAYRVGKTDWFGFGARDGARVFDIRVSEHALDDLEPTVRKGSDYLGIINRNRDRILRVARRLYEDGRAESDGVISVTKMDVPRYR
jgi:transcriptional regulator with XRE-family HTH domain